MGVFSFCCKAIVCGSIATISCLEIADVLSLTSSFNQDITDKLLVSKPERASWHSN